MAKTKPSSKLSKNKNNKPPKKFAQKNNFNNNNKPLNAKQIKRREYYKKILEREEMRKPSVCKYFVHGCCQREDCPYSHDVLPEQMKKFDELCKYYAVGECSKAEMCCYMHGEFPCKFFHSKSGNKCTKGENCLFSHEILTERMSNALEKHLLSQTNRVQITETLQSNIPTVIQPNFGKSLIFANNKASDTVSSNFESRVEDNDNNIPEIHSNDDIDTSQELPQNESYNSSSTFSRLFNIICHDDRDESQSNNEESLTTGAPMVSQKPVSIFQNFDDIAANVPIFTPMDDDSDSDQIDSVSTSQWSNKPLEVPTSGGVSTSLSSLSKQIRESNSEVELNIYEQTIPSNMASMHQPAHNIRPIYNSSSLTNKQINESDSEAELRICEPTNLLTNVTMRQPSPVNKVCLDKPINTSLHSLSKEINDSDYETELHIYEKTMIPKLTSVKKYISESHCEPTELLKDVTMRQPQPLSKPIITSLHSSLNHGSDSDTEAELQICEPNTPLFAIFSKPQPLHITPPIYNSTSMLKKQINESEVELQIEEQSYTSFSDKMSYGQTDQQKSTVNGPVNDRKRLAPITIDSSASCSAHKVFKSDNSKTKQSQTNHIAITNDIKQITHSTSKSTVSMDSKIPQNNNSPPIIVETLPRNNAKTSQTIDLSMQQVQSIETDVTGNTDVSQIKQNNIDSDFPSNPITEWSVVPLIVQPKVSYLQMDIDCYNWPHKFRDPRLYNHPQALKQHWSTWLYS